eukprot:CAMPEP_0183309454 /NCGR_PEP_ID=MMETSP0160_2-20130417/25352_1 /TAXON_ID=2839 ORGANISM="Odontella Sinensis, Strain Grunow 1884" /NCGR_SAMPLE_ID=MMETSP0160_2 /ASSEMBLY_ACC=CAM_ASM_000250 /LENGTH=346 /DNA_ID=CAMNT_0025473483 /DNA_START=66 /DNA_END=1106 /DNA_ORIENTATION=-
MASSGWHLHATSTSFILLVALSLSKFSSGKPENPFLKEIILGRCYESPPSGSIGTCQPLVGSFVSVIESRLDDDIEPEFFAQYYGAADFSSPEDGAVFWPLNSDMRKLPESATTVEDTAGGSLVSGLSFCGVDKRSDCGHLSGAASAFWEGAYGIFAAQAKGRVRVIITSKDDAHTIKTWVVPRLNMNEVSSFEIYAAKEIECDSDTMIGIEDSLLESGIGPSVVSCVDDPDLTRLLLCSDSSDSLACRCMEESQMPDTQTIVSPTMPDKPMDGYKAPAPATINGGGSSPPKPAHGSPVYAILFWGLLFVVAGAGFYAWSQRNWIPYDAVPEAIPEAPVIATFPKQ